MKGDMQNLFLKLSGLSDTDDDETVTAAVDALHDLVTERDMYRDRCLAAAKRMDEMALKLQALEARRKKANEA